MNRDTRALVDTFVSDKILTDREHAASAIEALRRDVRFQRLKAELAKTSFFEPDPWRYAARIGVLQIVLAASIVCMGSAPWPVRVLGMMLAAFAIVQGNFIAHEVDHGAVTKNARFREIVCQYLMTVVCGYSFSYFRRDHELHHFHCQEELRDPDTHSEIVSLFARAALEKRGIARLTTRYQHVLLPFLFILWGFDMKYEGLAYVIRNREKTRADQIGLFLHFALWLGLGGWYLGAADAVVGYLGWLVFVGLYIGLIIPVNHVGMGTIGGDPRLPFLEQQIGASRNILGPRMFDYLFVGLNLQIEHHLFPWVPATRLRAGSAIIRRFCVENRLVYHATSYSDALRETWSHLRRMASLTRGPAAAPRTLRSPGRDPRVMTRLAEDG